MHLGSACMRFVTMAMNTSSLWPRYMQITTAWNVATQHHNIRGLTQRWMQNSLNLNKTLIESNLTKLIIFSFQQNIAITFGGSVLKPTTSVRNLGAWLDSDFSMTRQVNSIIKAASLLPSTVHRQDPQSPGSRIMCWKQSLPLCHRALTTATARSPVQLRETSTACSGIRLLQNNAPRLITRSPRACHTTPVSYRIEYKVLTNAHISMLPAAAAAAVHCPASIMRSSCAHLLAVNGIQRRIGDSSFTV